MADRGLSPIPTSSPRTRVEKGMIKKPRGLTLRSHAKRPQPPAMEPVPGTSRDHPVHTPDHLPATQEVAETESIPSQDPPTQTAATGDSKFRLTPGPSITSYAAIVAMEASNPRLNMTIRPNRRGQLVITAKDEQTKTYLGQRENVLKLDINDRPTIIIFVYDLDLPLEPVLQYPSIITVKRCRERPEADHINWRQSTRELALLTYPSAFGAPSAPKSTSKSHSDASGVKGLDTINPAAQVRRSVGSAAADNTPPPTRRTQPHPTTQNPTPSSQQNPNPSRHSIPEPSSPPIPPHPPKPQRPPKPPSKEKRSPTHTPRTPSLLKLTSPTNSPTLTQPKQPEPNPSSSVPTTHTPNISHSLKEFPNLPSTSTSKSSASCPSKQPFNRDITKYIDAEALFAEASNEDSIIAGDFNAHHQFLNSISETNQTGRHLQCPTARLS
ncbi:uncharacterized protein [Palaemon carinicauda]|uniref:uncharacterized protein n=1 Tax=Palaemon carinicauda TaxID=392227 RepID=UPI0035B6363B